MITMDATGCMVSVNGGELAVCDVEVVDDGLKQMTITAFADLMSHFGMVVPLKLHVGDHVMEGKGLVTSVRLNTEVFSEHSVIRVCGALREVAP